MSCAQHDCLTYDYLFLFSQVYKSQRFRAGRGKMRNRRRIQRQGPLIVYAKDEVSLLPMIYSLNTQTVNP